MRKCNLGDGWQRCSVLHREQTSMDQWSHHFVRNTIRVRGNHPKSSRRHGVTCPPGTPAPRHGRFKKNLFSFVLISEEARTLWKMPFGDVAGKLQIKGHTYYQCQWTRRKSGLIRALHSDFSSRSSGWVNLDHWWHNGRNRIEAEKTRTIWRFFAEPIH